MIQVYFVATPIGNKSEITFRAVETLKSVDIIFCEDTRHSRPLLTEYGIDKPLKSYHKFNEKGALEGISDILSEGKSIAVISDAGMPGISDPGALLVKELQAKNIEYTVISGASALINAFVLSGFDAPFTFVGFLPEQKIDKDKLLDSVAANNTLIFYSSVHNINDDLKYLATALGDRRVCVVRELTKMFESLYFGKLTEMRIDSNKGEFVVVVDKTTATNPLNDLSVDEHIAYYVGQGLSNMDAIKSTARDMGVSKNEIYKHTIK